MVSFVPMNDLGVRQKYFVPTQEEQFGKVSSSYTYFSEGDVLLAKITPCFENGKLGIARDLTNGAGFGSSEFFVLRPKECLKAEYLFYYFSQDAFRDVGRSVMAGAVGHKRVPKEFIENHLLPLPTLSEQERIVAILDEAFAGIDAAVMNTEKNLANAKALVDRYLGRVFSQSYQTEPKRRLSEICTFSSGGTPTKRKYEYWDGALPWVSGRDMKSTRISDANLHVSELAVAESATRVAPVGSLLILVRGMGLAHGSQIAELMAPCAFNQDIKAIKPEDNVVPRYLVLALINKINSSHDLITSAAHGTLKMDTQKLKEVSVAVPSRERQVEIVEHVDDLISKTEQLKALYQRKRASLVELKQSLLQKAFTGELTAGEMETEAKEATA